MEPWIFMVEQTFQLCREISAFRKQLVTWKVEGLAPTIGCPAGSDRKLVYI